STVGGEISYDSMDQREVNRGFVDDLLAAGLAEDDTAGPLSVLDVGTGTAPIPIELFRRPVDLRVTAGDLAAQMLQLALKNVIRAGYAAQIKLEQVDAKRLPYRDGE